MQVLFYDFSKKTNSTKVPSNTGEMKHVVLKEPCTVLNPVMKLVDNPTTYNYCYIPSFGRYYHINNYQYVNGLWEVAASVDVLASFADFIKNTKANVLYASGSTKNIVDKRIPIQAGITVSKSDHAIEGFTISGITNQGAVILGVTGVGSFGQYLMQDSTRVKELTRGYDEWYSTEFSDVMQTLGQLTHSGSAVDCIKSALALPVVLGGSDVGSGAAEQIYLGSYPTGENGYHITKPIYRRTTQVTIPWKYSDWRRNSPYSEILLYLPFIGMQSVPTNDLINDSTLSVQYSLNVTSGDLAVSVRGTTTNKICATASTNIAMATPYGATGANVGRITTSVGTGAIAAVGGAISLATGGALAPAALAIGGGLATAASGTLKGIEGTSSGSGGLGGGASHGLDPVIHCYVVSRDLTDSQENFNSIMGKPYMGSATVGSFEGFVMTEGFSVNISASDSERKMINQQMDAGVYIE